MQWINQSGIAMSYIQTHTQYQDELQAARGRIVLMEEDVEIAQEQARNAQVRATGPSTCHAISGREN